MNTKDFVKKFHVIPHHRHLDKYARVDPYRHWMWIVLTSTIMSLVVVAFSVFMYYQITHGNFFATTEGETRSTQTVDKERLQTAISFFESKRERFDQERATPSTFIDPGI